MSPSRHADPPPVAGTVGARSAYVDLLRVLAITRVVVYHSLGVAWLTVVFPAVGVMFALAGSLMAASLDRRGAAAVPGRLRRLLPPVWTLAAVCVPVMLAGGMHLDWSVLWWLVPLHDPPADAWGSATLGMIWYLRQYLWFVLASPLALPAFRRWPVGCLLAPLALLVALSLTGTRAPGPVADLALYGDCWLLGFAHHDGVLRRLRRSTLLVAAGALAAAGGGWILTHPGPRGYDLNDIPLGNALWSAAFLLVLLGPAAPVATRVPHRAARLLTALNSRAMTVYLWHQTAIGVVAVAAGHWRIDLARPAGRLFLLAAVGTLLVLAVASFGWVEDVAAGRPPALLPTGERPVPLTTAERPAGGPYLSGPLAAQRRPDDLAVSGHRGTPIGGAGLDEVQTPATGGHAGPP
ncbi:acyltransferase family protein [Planosporangium sp. 12N6]|uniref:acyltransferase family protein n=1 Tax=Planosporangium spinosum TaxID=3402278 RepID=UPI003CE92EFA